MPKTYPSFDCYPGDYHLLDIATCSLAAQGLWHRLEILMHTSDRYGYLQWVGKAMPDALVAPKVGIPLDEYLGLLKEMEANNVILREPYTGTIYSPELIKQDAKRAGIRKRSTTPATLQKNPRNLRRTLSQTLLNFSLTLLQLCQKHF